MIGWLMSDQTRTWMAFAMIVALSIVAHHFIHGLGP